MILVDVMFWRRKWPMTAAMCTAFNYAVVPHLHSLMIMGSVAGEDVAWCILRAYCHPARA